jgi:crotonobetainyl-CoA:carnitine CoA-transferase CaiB-like acyl-CoA transferase
VRAKATLATMGWVVSNYLIAGREPIPMGNENSTASPSGAFRTGKGLLNIAANKQEQFEAVCRVVGRDDLIDDPRFAERQARLQHRFELKEILETAQHCAGSPLRSGGSFSTRRACRPGRCTAFQRRWTIPSSAIAA